MEGEKGLENKNVRMIGGLPLDLKTVVSGGGETQVEGVSGASYSVRVSPTSLRIDGPTGDEFFYADIHERRDGRYINFSIRTKALLQSEYNTDLYAGRLADEAIRYFSEAGGLRGIEFDWYPYAKDQKYYLQSKEEIKARLLAGGETEGAAETEAAKQAALTTWTAKRIAVPHGFTGVKVWEGLELIDPAYPAEVVVRGYFYKPGQGEDKTQGDSV